MTRITMDDIRKAEKAVGGLKGGLLKDAVLRAVFCLVENSLDEKGPLDARILADFCPFDKKVIRSSVRSYHGAPATITEEPPYWHVTAPVSKLAYDPWASLKK
jgi:hypothetical protein